MGCVSSSRKVLPDANANEIFSSRIRKTNHGTTKLPIRGDLIQKEDSRKHREKKLKDKQQKKAFAAEEMSCKVMDERERLSLSTRATSRATSRTSSPTLGARKHVQFKDTSIPVGNETRADIDSDNMNGRLSNGTKPSNSCEVSKTVTKSKENILIADESSDNKNTTAIIPIVTVTLESEKKLTLTGNFVPIVQLSPTRKVVAVT